MSVSALCFMYNLHSQTGWPYVTYYLMFLNLALNIFTNICVHSFHYFVVSKIWTSCVQVSEFFSTIHHHSQFPPSKEVLFNSNQQTYPVFLQCLVPITFSSLTQSWKSLSPMDLDLLQGSPLFYPSKLPRVIGQCLEQASSRQRMDALRMDGWVDGRKKGRKEM